MFIYETFTKMISSPLWCTEASTLCHLQRPTYWNLGMFNVTATCALSAMFSHVVLLKNLSCGMEELNLCSFLYLYMEVWVLLTMQYFSSMMCLWKPDFTRHFLPCQAVQSKSFSLPSTYNEIEVTVRYCQFTSIPQST